MESRSPDECKSLFKGVNDLAPYLWLSFALLGGCLLVGPSRPPEKYAKHWAFCHKPGAERGQLFSTLPIDRQLETYLVCMKHYHPPLSTLAYNFAKNGKDGVSLIVGKLNSTTDQLNIVDLIFALRVISDQGEYDVEHDAIVIKSIQDAINKVTFAVMKADGEANLKRILTRTSNIERSRELNPIRVK